MPVFGISRTLHIGRFVTTACVIALRLSASAFLPAHQRAQGSASGLCRPLLHRAEMRCSGTVAACVIEWPARQSVVRQTASSRVTLGKLRYDTGLQRANTIHSASCEALLHLGCSRRCIVRSLLQSPLSTGGWLAGCFIECVGHVRRNCSCGWRSEERTQFRIMPAEAGHRGQSKLDDVAIVGSSSSLSRRTCRGLRSIAASLLIFRPAHGHPHAAQSFQSRQGTVPSGTEPIIG